MGAHTKPGRMLAAAVIAGCCAVSAASIALTMPRHTPAAVRTALTDEAGASSASKIVSARKGVSAWAFGGAGNALRASGATWYYTWSTSHSGITTPRGVRFVPMVWGSGSVTPAALAQAQHESHTLLTFNEPDLSSQSSMTVPAALSLWPQLEATHMRLSSPAVSAGANIKGGWLWRFLAGAKQRHYRVNFIALHWYGSDFRTPAAVSQLRDYLQAVWERYHKPIWLTEFALIRFGASAVFPSAARQAAFVTAATAMMRRLPYVWRYAWFALPVTTGSTGDGTAGLFRPGAIPSAAGRAFEKVPAHS